MNGRYFILIMFPFGPKPMVNDSEDPSDPKVVFFETEDEARTVALRSRAVTAYGGEIFELGQGECV